MEDVNSSEHSHVQMDKEVAAEGTSSEALK